MLNVLCVPLFVSWSRSSALLLVLLLIVVSAAACGGDDPATAPEV